jgi:hypothetical protein
MFSTDGSGTTKRIDENGFLVAYNVPIAKTGIQFYSRRELSDYSGHPDDEVPVFRNPDAFDDEKVVESFDGNPVTYDHPREGYVNSDNYPDYAIGTLSQPFKNGEDLYAKKITIFNKTAIDKIWNKEMHELSIGFKGMIDKKEGFYQGQRYEFEETVIHGNHLALCERGKAGQKYAINSKQIGVDTMSLKSKRFVNSEHEEHYKDAEAMGGDAPTKDIGEVAHRAQSAQKSATSHKQMNDGDEEHYADADGEVSHGIEREKEAVGHLEKKHMLGDNNECNSEMEEIEHKDKDLINSYKYTIQKLKSMINAKTKRITELEIELNETETHLVEAIDLLKQSNDKSRSRSIINAMTAPDRKSATHPLNLDLSNGIAESFNCMFHVK